MAGEAKKTSGWAAAGLMGAGTSYLIGPAFTALEEAKIESLLLKHAATMAEFDAQSVELQADVAERGVRKKGSQIVGAARVVAGSSGFAAESKSNLDAIEDIDRNVELNALALRSEGRVGAGKFRDKASSLRSQARITSTFGKAKAAGTMLSSAKDIAFLTAI